MHPTPLAALGYSEGLILMREGANGDRTTLQNGSPRSSRVGTSRQRRQWTRSCPPTSPERSRLNSLLNSTDSSLNSTHWNAQVSTTRATPDAVLDLITHPAPTYEQLRDADRRRYNQAWFSRIYVHAHIDGLDVPPNALGERTPFAKALQVSRQLAELSLKTDPDPEMTDAAGLRGVRRHLLSGPCPRQGFQ